MVNRSDINDIANEMLSDNTLSIDQRKGIKKLLKKINNLPNSNQDDIDSYKLGYNDGYDTALNKYNITENNKPDMRYCCKMFVIGGLI